MPCRHLAYLVSCSLGPSRDSKADRTRQDGQTCTPAPFHGAWGKVMSFKLANYGTSDVPMLTCGLKVDWLGLPLQSFLAKLPTLKRGVLAGIFQPKGECPRGGTPGLTSSRCLCTCRTSSQWTLGTRQSQIFRPCGRRSQRLALKIRGKSLASTSMRSERNLMRQECGEKSLLSGTSSSSICRLPFRIPLADPLFVSL